MSNHSIAGISIAALLADIGNFLSNVSGENASQAAIKLIDANLSKFPKSMQQVGNISLKELVSAWQTNNSIEAGIIRESITASLGTQFESKTEPKPILRPMIAAVQREGYKAKRVPASTLDKLSQPVDSNSGDLKAEYATIAKSLQAAFSEISVTNNEVNFIEIIDAILLNHSWCLPFHSKSGDISIYDVCRPASALAGALYQYRIETNKEVNETDNQLLIIHGDFVGIQNFIFEGGGITQKRLARLLRGRSFMVSLLVELAGLLLVELSGLTPLQVLSSVAGKLTFVGSNTDTMKAAVIKTEKIVNDWLVQQFYGEVSIVLSITETSINDFKKENFKSYKERSANNLERKKLQRFENERYGVQKGLLDSVAKHGICGFCNRRAASEHLEEEINCCSSCSQQIRIGSNLLKKSTVAIYLDQKDTAIFGRYRIEIQSETKQDAIVCYSLTPGNTPFRLIGGQIPIANQKTKDQLELTGFEPANNEKIYDGQAISFEHLAHLSRTEPKTGLVALGVLKSDLDRLGQLFESTATSLSTEKALSRQVHHFFTIYLQKKLQENHSLIYTVFAGGDDLFLIGPWTDALELTKQLPNYLKEYSDHNQNVTISSGFTLHDAGQPVVQMATESETALELAKVNRNESCIFGISISPEELIVLEERKQKYIGWLKRNQNQEDSSETNERVLNSAMLYRWLDFSDLAARDKEIGSAKIVKFAGKDMEALKWRSYFRYSLVRNIKDEQIREEMVSVSDDLETYDKKLRIPLSEIIYKNRKRN